MNSCIVANAGKDQNVEITLRGHWLYARKCEKPDVRDNAGEVLIEVPDKSKDWNPDEQPTWLEILGVAPEVGRPREKSKRKRLMKQYGKYIPICMDEYYEVGDLVLCPNNHPFGIMHSPYADDEFFIDEYVPIAGWSPYE